MHCVIAHDIGVCVCVYKILVTLDFDNITVPRIESGVDDADLDLDTLVDTVDFIWGFHCNLETVKISEPVVRRRLILSGNRTVLVLDQA